MLKGATFPKLYDISELADAIVIASNKVNAAYDEDALRKALEVFRAPFEGGGTAYRTTTKEKRTINTRYFSWAVPHYPFDMAIESGILVDDGHPCMEVIPYMVENYSLFGDSSGFGVDIGAAYGLEKIWTFVQDSVPLDELLKMPYLPPAVGENVDYFKKHQMDVVKVVGIDFRAKSMNLYFMSYEIGGLSPEKVTSLIGDLGFNMPNDDVLMHCSFALPIYHTFLWSSPKIQRVCFASGAPDPALVPTWDPVMAKFVAGAPAVAKNRMFLYNPTFTLNGKDYTKVEMCFHESFLTELMRITPEPYIEDLKMRQGTYLGMVGG
jgi:hypothetical protein